MTPAERRVIEAARELKAAREMAKAADVSTFYAAWTREDRAALMLESAMAALDAPQEAAPQDVVWVALDGQYAAKAAEDTEIGIGPWTVARYVREDEPQKEG